MLETAILKSWVRLHLNAARLVVPPMHIAQCFDLSLPKLAWLPPFSYVVSRLT